MNEQVREIYKINLLEPDQRNIKIITYRVDKNHNIVQYQTEIGVKTITSYFR